MQKGEGIPLNAYDITVIIIVRLITVPGGVVWLSHCLNKNINKAKCGWRRGAIPAPGDWVNSVWKCV